MGFVLHRSNGNINSESRRYLTVVYCHRLEVRSNRGSTYSLFLVIYNFTWTVASVIYVEHKRAFAFFTTISHSVDYWYWWAQERYHSIGSYTNCVICAVLPTISQHTQNTLVISQAKRWYAWEHERTYMETTIATPFFNPTYDSSHIIYLQLSK